MPPSSAKLSVLVAGNRACLKIAGRANFTCSPDFKALLAGLGEKGYNRFTIDLSECVLMDSTFLGVLAGFGLATNPGGDPDKRQIELLNANPRVTELLENLGVLHLFRVATGESPAPDGAKPAASEQLNPTPEQITRTCLDAHRTLMAANPENVARFKDVAQFLAEDLKNLEKR